MPGRKPLMSFSSRTAKPFRSFWPVWAQSSIHCPKPALWSPMRVLFALPCTIAMALRCPKPLRHQSPTVAISNSDPCQTGTNCAAAVPFLINLEPTYSAPLAPFLSQDYSNRTITIRVMNHEPNHQRLASRIQHQPPKQHQQTHSLVCRSRHLLEHHCAALDHPDTGLYGGTGLAELVYLGIAHCCRVL